MQQHTLEIPMDCLAGLVESFTQYPLGFRGGPFDKPNPVILDIGANIGGFSLACLQRWPEPVIHAYEPHPEAFRVLCGNVHKLGVKCHNVAVGDPERTKLFPGRDNNLTGSLYNIGRQDLAVGIHCETIDPIDLPAADLVKIDTEGGECEIIDRLVIYRTREELPSALIVEWHSHTNRVEIEKTLHVEYALHYCAAMGGGWGVSVYTKAESGRGLPQSKTLRDKGEEVGK